MCAGVAGYQDLDNDQLFTNDMFANLLAENFKQLQDVRRSRAAAVQWAPRFPYECVLSLLGAWADV